MNLLIKCPHPSLARVRRAGVAGAVLALAALAAACGKQQAPAAAPPAIEVTAVTVQPRDVPVNPEFVAQTQSSRQVNIHARVSGFLDKRVYTEGALVKEGQVLFLMDAKPFQAQLDAQKAALARQEAAMETARANLARVKPLAAQNALSQKDLDDATGQYHTNAASVEQAKAEVETARLNLSYCKITSPLTGIASAAQQQDGTYISPQNSLLTTVAALSPMWVNFSISENELQDLRDQMAKGLIKTPQEKNYVVEVILVDGSLFPHTGRITFADFSFNPQTGTFLVRASVNNPDGILRPNQFVRVRLKGAQRPNAILVPQRAVQQGAKGHFVWVSNKENKAEYRPVVVGDWYGDQWFVNEGLQAGDQVVVDGGLTLAPGAAVKAVPLDAVPVTGKPVAPAKPADAAAAAQQKKR